MHGLRAEEEEGREGGGETGGGAFGFANSWRYTAK